jgi:DNA modification methylase
MKWRAAERGGVFSPNKKTWIGAYGLETTPELYVQHTVEVFREVRRVLRDDGTLWLNLGDSYAGSWGDSGHRPERSGKAGVQREKNSEWFKRNGHAGSLKSRVPGLKPKDLCGIPWRVAFALQADGWYLRQDIIWYFYDAQAIAEPAATKPHNSGYVNGDDYAVGPMDRGGNSQREDPNRVWAQNGTKNKRSVWTVKPKAFPEAHFATFPPKLIEPCILAGTSKKGRCPECGGPWERVVEKELVPTKKASHTHIVDARDLAADKNDQGSNRQKDGHKAGWAYQVETLGWRPTCKCKQPVLGGYDPIPYTVRPCIVFDPFIGAGTTAVVAAQLGRDYVGTELNPEYVTMARKRLLAAETGVSVKEADMGQMALFSEAKE